MLSTPKICSGACDIKYTPTGILCVSPGGLEELTDSNLAKQKGSASQPHLFRWLKPQQFLERKENGQNWALVWMSWVVQGTVGQSHMAHGDEHSLGEDVSTGAGKMVFICKMIGYHPSPAHSESLPFPRHRTLSITSASAAFRSAVL